jgi:hypothetical protein
MYYDYLSVCVAELCDCNYTDNGKLIDSLCSYCKKREDKEKEQPWYLEVKTLKPLLTSVEYTPEKEQKIVIIKKIIDYLLTVPKFLAMNTNFRIAIKAKINEFINDERAKELHESCNSLDIFINNLIDYEGYQ